MTNRKISVLFFRPSLGQGGADRVTVTVLKNLDRERYSPKLALLHAKGEWLDQVPSDVPVLTLAASRVRFAAPALRQLVRREAPDVVFSTSSGTNAITVAACRSLLKRPKLVISERNILFNGGVTRYRKVDVALKRRLYPLADTVTALSRGVADDLAEKLGLNRDDLQVLYNPLVDDQLAVRAQEAVQHRFFKSEGPVVISAARLVPHKGFDDLIEAFAIVCKTLPKAKLIILGEGKHKNHLVARANKLGLAEQIDFVGFQKNPYAWFNKADVFALASYNEGLCNVLVESMASGTPVISTDCPHGPNEIITHASDGFLTKVGDQPELASRVLEVLQDSKLRAKLAKAAVKSADRFRIEAVTGNYERAIDSAHGRK